MVDTIFAFDTNDSALGDFFKSCKSDIESFFKEINHEIKVIHNNQLNDLTVSLKVKELNTFVFGAYSHGDNNCLVVSGITPYVSTTINNTLFKNSFFYTFSCSSGKELGSNLIDNNCLCFIGYKQNVSIWTNEQRPFVITANSGIKLFYQNKNSEEVIQGMKDEYNNQIDNVYKNDTIVASSLKENRDALISIGKKISMFDLI